jgi:transcriptional regulator with XRE-family HTH domain
MPTRPRASLRAPGLLAGRQLGRRSAASLGERVHGARVRRGWTLAELGEKVGLTGTRIGQIERGIGSGSSIEVWFALAVVLDLPLKIEFGRDALEQPADAGHLAIQELMLRLARAIGVTRFFELPTKPQDPWHSIDVGWRDDARRVFIINECWNGFTNINGSVRSTHRKIADAEQLAAAASKDGQDSYRVAACWIVRDTRRNRELIGAYPEVFATAFPASSQAWVHALTNPIAPVPTAAGLVWSDVRSTRLFAWRQRARLRQAAAA